MAIILIYGRVYSHICQRNTEKQEQDTKADGRVSSKEFTKVTEVAWKDNVTNAEVLKTD